MEDNNNLEQKTEILAEDNASLVEKESVEDTSSTNSSPKPQAVLDELDKLKTASSEASSSVESSESTSTTDEKVSSEIVSDSSLNDRGESSDKIEEIKIVTPVVADNSDSTNVEELSDNKIESEPSSSLDKNKLISSKEYSSNESSFKRYFNVDFWKSFFFDIIFLLFCVFFVFVLVQKWFSSQEAKIIGTNQVHSSLESGEKTAIGNINVLVMGLDSVEGTHRSDTIFVLGVNPSKGKITMLSIPRDTRVIIENKARKINEILPRYGEPTLRKILEDLLKINISRKIEVGFESFIEVVDAIGGVDINIEKAMNYDDNWGNLHIHFKPGMNHLDGQDALRYVRFRKDAMADLGRIKRQQDFVKAVVKKIMSPASIVRLPNIIEKAFKHIKTDFTLQEILTLAKGFNTTDIKIRTMSVPGEARYVDKISYFMPYSEEAIAIGSNYFSDLAIFEIEKNYEADRIMPIQSKTDRKNK